MWLWTKNSLNHQWYAAEVAAQLQSMKDERTHSETEKINRDINKIKTSVIKAIHARWLIAATKEMTQKTSCIIKGFIL